MANPARPRQEPEITWERYSRLPPGPKAVLRLKSLIFLPTTKSVFSDTLTQSGSKTPEGRAWSNQSINVALESLGREQLLTEDLACVPALLHPVAIDAIAAPDGERMVAAIRRAFTPSLSVYYGSTISNDPVPMIRLARLAVYANDDTSFVAQRDKHDAAFAPHRLTSAFGLLLKQTPLGINWLDSRTPTIQLALLEGLMTAFLVGVLDIPGWQPMIARYRGLQDKRGFAPVRRILLEHDLLTLRLDEARSLLAKLEPAEATAQQTAEAALCFLAGDNARSIELYRSALKALRKQAGKRKLFLPGAHGLLFLMALLRAEDAKLHAEIQAGIDVLPADGRPHPAGWIALQVLLWLAQGLEGKARELMERFREFRTADPLSEACLALAAHAVDPDLLRKRVPDLAARFAALQDSLRLPARILAEILADVAPASAPVGVFLDQTAEVCRVTFTQLIRTSALWERALESLDAVLFAASPKGLREASARPAKRLVWFVDPETLLIDIAEQSAKGRDGWTDGRPVAMKRLHEQDPRLDYLTSQGCSTLWNAEQVEEAIEAADGGAEAVLWE